MDVELDGSNRVCWKNARSAQLECDAKTMSIRVTFSNRVSARDAFRELEAALESGRETKIVLQAAR